MFDIVAGYDVSVDLTNPNDILDVAINDRTLEVLFSLVKKDHNYTF